MELIKMIWTDEAVEELKKMWDKGMTTGQIAKVLNVTKNSIIGKVHRLCLTARPSPIKKSNKTTEEKKATSAKKAEKTTKAKSCTPAPKKLEQAPIKEEVKLVVPAPDEINIPLVKLDNHTCRWPMGDPRDEDFCFCGKRIKTGQTYCEEHAAIAYVKPGKKI
jgi:GcrA cell cycle regulator